MRNGADARVVLQKAATNFGIADCPYFATHSVEPRKNLNLVLQAWDRVRTRLPKDTVLLVIGGKGKSKVFSHSEMNVENVEV